MFCVDTFLIWTSGHCVLLCSPFVWQNVSFVINFNTAGNHVITKVHRTHKMAEQALA